MKKLIIFCSLFLTGCALWETREVFLGPSLSTIRKVEKKYEKSIDKDIVYCYDTTIKIIKDDMGAEVYKKDRRRGYIIGMAFDTIFPGCLETTGVGIIFKETEPGKTKIEVASGNYNLAEFVAKQLFDRLEGKISLGEKISLVTQKDLEQP